jgi:hypothetical protein
MKVMIFFSMARQPPVGLGLIIVEVSISHSVGLLWTSDGPFAETSSTTHNTHKTDIRFLGGI